MAAEKKEPSILEVLRAIRDKMSRKLLTMTREEQMAYIAEGAKWYTHGPKKPVRAKRKAAARPVATRRKPATKKVMANHAKTSARKAK